MKKMLIIFVIIILIISNVLLYSRFIATKGLKVKEYKIESDKITEPYHGLKLVHISDLHYGTTVFEKELDKIVNKINYINPDIVVITGDLIDDNEKYDKDILIKFLNKINAKLGKYAISGNHDKPIEDFNEIIKQGGFINLDNKYKLIFNNSNEPIVISGVSSNYENNQIKLKTKEFDEYISKNKPIYSILLMHEPDYIDDLNKNNYDLVLAGHSHNGQINIPFLKKYVLPKGSQKYYKEYYKLDNTDLFISSGIGTSKIKFRLFNKPSINFYRITKK